MDKADNMWVMSTGQPPACQCIDERPSMDVAVLKVTKLLGWDTKMDARV